MWCINGVSVVLWKRQDTHHPSGCILSKVSEVIRFMQLHGSNPAGSMYPALDSIEALFSLKYSRIKCCHTDEDTHEQQTYCHGPNFYLESCKVTEQQQQTHLCTIAVLASAKSLVPAAQGKDTTVASKMVARKIALTLKPASRA